MDFTADKLRSLVRKWQTLIEAHVDIKTTDGYLLRLFCIGFTKKRQGQIKKTCYAQSSQIRQIRKKMTEIMVREATNCDLKELVSKFIPEAIGALCTAAKPCAAACRAACCKCCICCVRSRPGASCRQQSATPIEPAHWLPVAQQQLRQHSSYSDNPLSLGAAHAGKDIEKNCQGIYPLQSVYIRKVKVLRAPKFDITKLMEVHGDYAEEVGTKVARPATEEQPETAAETEES